MASMTEDFKVRRARREDSKKIWVIRDAPEARSVSHNQEPIPFLSHDAWFENKYFKSDEHRCYVLVIRDEIYGYCRFDRGLEKGVFVVSIALHPSYQGKGLGSRFLKEALALFDLPGAMEADVSITNAASLRLFEKLDFKKTHEDGSYAYYKLERK